MKFKTRLTAGKVENIDGLGIVDVVFASEIVKARQANHLVAMLRRHNFFPYIVRDKKIELVQTLADAAFLTV
ncbi:MAG TPA: hypothetical protein VJQ55_16540 [Candidatus Binatia bacterium]|nr:hypothetical protein [Candidatus Binatia bacterium]